MDVDFADRVVAVFGHVNIADRIHHHGARAVELGAGGQSAITTGRGRARGFHGAGISRDDSTGQVHFANHVVAVVGDIHDVAVWTEGYSGRAVEFRIGSQAAFAAWDCGTRRPNGAGHGGDNASVFVDSANCVVGEVGDVNVALGVGSRPARAVEQRRAGQSAVATGCDGTGGARGAGEGADNAGGRINLAQCMTAEFGDINVIGGVYAHACR